MFIDFSEQTGMMTFCQPAPLYYNMKLIQIPYNFNFYYVFIATKDIKKFDYLIYEPDPEAPPTIESMLTYNNDVFELESF